MSLLPGMFIAFKMFEESSPLTQTYYRVFVLKTVTIQGVSFVDHWNVGAKKSIPAMSSITDTRTHQMFGKQGKRKAENPLNDAASKRAKRAVSFFKISRTSTGY